MQATHCTGEEFRASPPSHLTLHPRTARKRTWACARWNNSSTLTPDCTALLPALSLPSCHGGEIRVLVHADVARRGVRLHPDRGRGAVHHAGIRSRLRGHAHHARQGYPPRYFRNLARRSSVGYVFCRYVGNLCARDVLREGTRTAVSRMCKRMGRVLILAAMQQHAHQTKETGCKCVIEKRNNF